MTQKRGVQMLKGYTFKELMTILSLGNWKIQHYCKQFPNNLEVKKKGKCIIVCTTIFTFMYCVPLILMSASISMISEFTVFLVYFIIIEAILLIAFMVYFNRNATSDLIPFIDSIKQYYEA